MITEVLVLFFSFLFSYIIYYDYKMKKKFSENGLKFQKGVLLLGNVMNSTFLRRNIWEDIDAVYKAFPGEKYVGFMDLVLPIIIIRDPELMKSITVKDFDHFVNHRQFFPEEVEPVFGGSMIMMQDERWRDMRTTLSPAFTGSKMRHMIPFMSQISNNVVQCLKENFLDVEIDVKDIMRHYTSDVIASTNFGMEVNSVKDKDNQFYKHGQKFFEFSLMQKIKFIIASQWPNLAKKLRLRLFPSETKEFFRDLVAKTIEYRKKYNVDRPDIIKLLMEASKEWTLDELTSQVFTFFSAGFENTATSLFMSIHELALHPDIQERLYQDIKAFKEKYGIPNCDNINELKYLDCVMNESLRKWSPAKFTDRVCSKSYELPPPREGGQPYNLKPGDVVYIMVNSLHMDPKYFPDPDKFDPERFSDENKHNIKPFTFVPFGVGPRNCIGSRFALLEIKVMLYDIVLNFKILKSPKTSDPITLAPNEFNINAKGGTWVRLETRN